MTSLWDGIGDAQLFDRGVFMQGGFEGDIRINRTLARPTRKVGTAFIVEFTVEKVMNSPKNEDGSPMYRVGWKGSWFVKLQDRDVAFSNIAAWAAAVAGYDPQTQKEQIKAEILPELQGIMKAATDHPDQNDFIDQIVHLVTVQVTTKENKPFTRHDWSPHRG